MRVCSDYRQIVLLRSFVEAEKMYVYDHSYQTNNGCLFVVITYKFDLPSTLSKFVGLQNDSLLSICSVFLYKQISYSRLSAFTGIQRPTDVPRTVVRREAQI